MGANARRPRCNASGQLANSSEVPAAAERVLLHHREGRAATASYGCGELRLRRVTSRGATAGGAAAACVGKGLARRAERLSPGAENGVVRVGKLRQRDTCCSCRQPGGVRMKPDWPPPPPSSAPSPWLGGTWLLPGPTAPLPLPAALRQRGAPCQADAVWLGRSCVFAHGRFQSEQLGMCAEEEGRKGKASRQGVSIDEFVLSRRCRNTLQREQPSNVWAWPLAEA